MILNKTNQEKVNFADFCKLHDLNAFDVGKLCQLVQRRVKNVAYNAKVHTQEKAESKDERLTEKIRSLGKEMGLEISFPSSYPSVAKNGRQIRLPL